MANDTTIEPSDFFASLVEDHARIETQLKTLVQAVGALSRTESDPAALAAIDGVLSFFATDGARHEDIEERTLFPRFRSLAQFKQILSALELQHQMNRTAGEELKACVARFAPGNGRELQRSAFRFVDMHRGHAVAEERALFPLAASVLSPKDLAEMSRELRERKPAVSSTGEARR
jgi:hemerythrin-like domain-containing protein